MRRKYGFTTRLQFQEYARLWYDRFFVLHPWLAPYRLLPEDHVAGPRAAPPDAEHERIMVPGP